jgi:hypothetical protein
MADGLMDWRQRQVGIRKELVGLSGKLVQQLTTAQLTMVDAYGFSCRSGLEVLRTLERCSSAMERRQAAVAAATCAAAIGAVCTVLVHCCCDGSRQGRSPVHVVAAEAKRQQQQHDDECDTDADAATVELLSQRQQVLEELLAVEETTAWRLRALHAHFEAPLREGRLQGGGAAAAVRPPPVPALACLLSAGLSGWR